MADNPECDLSGCQYIYPVTWWQLLAQNGRFLVKRPGRYLHALRIALTAPRESWRNRIKLLGQLLVSVTAVPRVEQLAPGLMHAHLANPPTSYAMFLSLLTGIPFSFTAHAADLYRFPVATEAKLRQAAGVVAISEYNLRHYRDLVPDLANARVIHCGVRLGDFQCRTRQEVSPPLKILAVGRAVPKKGFEYLLEALARLERPWTCHLVGGGPLLDDLKRRRKDLQLSELTITGALQQREIRSLLDEADVFVLPCVTAADGDVDGIPVSLMEAMACGCPVISSRVSGIPELLADGEAGLLVPPGDPEALAAALERLATSPDLIARLSLAGRRRIEESFDIASESERLRDFFATILARQSGDR